MMAYTDRHCRYLHRLLAPRALLFTEMVTTGAILHGPRSRVLALGPATEAIALQLGGSDPDQLARCAAIGAEWGYAEINLNVGCPSDRVRQGAFGAGLMREPELVAACVRAMTRATTVPVTVKCRLGVDEIDHYPYLRKFADTVRDAGCQRLYVHARRAILGKLSPAENCRIPPLNYSRVHALARDIAPLPVVINGGLTRCADIAAQLALTHGVMLGRAAFHNPRLLIEVNTLLNQRAGSANAHEPARVLLQAQDAYRTYRDYAVEQARAGENLGQLVKPLLGLFNGERGARRYRRQLSEACTGVREFANALTCATDELGRARAA